MDKASKNLGYDIKEKAVVKDSLICDYELLSPAGDMDCLYAAVASGADAVYAGADRFSARAYAGNFDEAGLIKALRHVHLFGKKLYLTLNTLVKEREFDGIYSFVRPFYEEGLDGVIIQDLGIAGFLRDNFPGLKLHASTQMSICTSYGANFVKSFGIERIVPARELSLQEIKRLRQESGLEIECFIHGAMCYSFSGQCLMSSFLGGRSANRGRCAGPCRLSYICGNDNRKNVTGQKHKGSEKPQKSILSMKDMCTIDILHKLMDAGVCSFKIEGRMKPPEYVANVTSIYRKYMDLFMEKGKEAYRVSEDDRKKLIELYSRGGISPGYYERKNGPDMINTGKSGYKSAESRQGSYIPEKLKKDVTAFCVIKQGEPSRLELEADGVKITHTGAVPETAKTRALSEEDIKKQIMKTGDSDLRMASVLIDTDKNSFLPVSVLNGLRREAAERLYERLNSGFKRSV